MVMKKIAAIAAEGPTLRLALRAGSRKARRATPADKQQVLRFAQDDKLLAGCGKVFSTSLSHRSG
jgi:hypothetical protein